MIKRLAPLLLLLALAAPAAGPELDYGDLYEFHQAYDLFIRHMKGCPDSGYDESQCRKAAGTFDLLAFRRASRYAKKVFR